MLVKKYQALLHEVARRGTADAAAIHLCFRVLSLASKIDSDCATLLAPYGLSEGRFILLFLLDSNPEGIAPNVLAEKAGITKATVSYLLDALAGKGLISRIANKQDRRGIRAMLTPKGQKLAKNVFDRHTQWIGSLFSELNDKERVQLTQILNKLERENDDTQR